MFSDNILSFGKGIFKRPRTKGSIVTSGIDTGNYWLTSLTFSFFS